jgi:di- and tripeptidase
MSTSPSIPHPSVSRDLNSAASIPRLSHSLHDPNSVLSLSADTDHIFTGSQCFDISVWDKKSFTYKTSLVGHTGSILALEYAEDKKWLFSSSGDSSVRIWSTTTLTPIYVLNPYLETGAGDLFSLVWSQNLQILYIGCQNTSLQWFDFNSNANVSSPGSATSTPGGHSRKVHKFFDSYPLFDRRPADIYAMNGMMTPPMTILDSDGCVQHHPSAPSPRGF